MKVGHIATKMNALSKELLDSFDTMYTTFSAFAGYILPRTEGRAKIPYPLCFAKNM
jgi:hypothetical protein